MYGHEKFFKVIGEILPESPRQIIEIMNRFRHFQEKYIKTESEVARMLADLDTDMEFQILSLAHSLATLYDLVEQEAPELPETIKRYATLLIREVPNVEKLVEEQPGRNPYITLPYGPKAYIRSLKKCLEKRKH
ncbi:MAG: hypothetical protein KatS3mg090_0550 [Patescibacteria group bacterium]|nr:MAG: hypothetical protein KatS3mg090_0550 [Patescibacteria group bacterium]